MPIETITVAHPEIAGLSAEQYDVIGEKAPRPISVRALAVNPEKPGFSSSTTMISKPRPSRVSVRSAIGFRPSCQALRTESENASISSSEAICSGRFAGRCKRRER